jgi:tryptophanyl-tRNA synthetase
MVEDFRRGGVGYGEFKQRLFEAIWIKFEAERIKRAELLANLDHVEDVLRRGAEKARAVATQTMERVRKAVGLR